MCYLVIVCFFLHNSRVTSTEIYCKHTGKIVLKYALSNMPSAYPCQPATYPSLGPANLCKHDLSSVNQVVVRRSEARMPACTGPTCQFEIPSLKRELVSSLASCCLLSELTNAGSIPCARVSLLPWIVPFVWNTSEYTIVCHKSQS